MAKTLEQYFTLGQEFSGELEPLLLALLIAHDQGEPIEVGTKVEAPHQVSWEVTDNNLRANSLHGTFNWLTTEQPYIRHEMIINNHGPQDWIVIHGVREVYPVLPMIGTQESQDVFTVEFPTVAEALLALADTNTIKN